MTSRCSNDQRNDQEEETVKVIVTTRRGEQGGEKASYVHGKELVYAIVNRTIPDCQGKKLTANRTNARANDFSPREVRLSQVEAPVEVEALVIALVPQRPQI